jgi:ribonuclease PH
MTPVRINIPSAERQTVQAAGQLVIDALEEAGINSDSPIAMTNQMVGDCLGMWGRGEWTREQFIKAMRNLAILNPSLKR